MKKNILETKWKKNYNDGPAVVLKGWQIKEDTDIQTPICVVPEPIGGHKNDEGRSPYQEARATLIEHAPEMLQQLKAMHIVADILLAELITAKTGIMPSKHHTWPTLTANHKLIKKLEGK